MSVSKSKQAEMDFMTVQREFVGRNVVGHGGERGINRTIVAESPSRVWALLWTRSRGSESLLPFAGLYSNCPSHVA